MKPLTLFLCIMVTLSLAFSIAAFSIVAQNNGFLIPNNSPSPTSPANNSPTASPIKNPTSEYTDNPTPKPTLSTKILITPTETSKENLANNKTRVIYTVTATYTEGPTITLHYSDFYLQLYTSRFIYILYQGEATPENSGTITLSPSHTTETFQLTFEFSSTNFNGMDLVLTQYEFHYKGYEQ